MPKVLSPAELSELRESQLGLALFDIRESAEYEAGHIRGATSLPRRMIELRIATLVPVLSTPIVVYGDDSPRADFAAELLEHPGARPQQQVVGVGEQDLRPARLHLRGRVVAKARVGGDRHEGRGLHRPPAGVEHARPGAAGCDPLKLEPAGHEVVLPDVRRQHSGMGVTSFDDVDVGVSVDHDRTGITVHSPRVGTLKVALELPASYYAALAAAYDARRQRLLPILERAGFRTYRPRGAYYVMTEIDRLGWDDDVAFARHLVETVGVAVVPGSSFYQDPAHGRRQVRFAFCKKDETLAEAERRLAMLSAR